MLWQNSSKDVLGSQRLLHREGFEEARSQLHCPPSAGPYQMCLPSQIRNKSRMCVESLRTRKPKMASQVRLLPGWVCWYIIAV